MILDSYKTIEEINLDIAKKISKIRKRKNITQEQLAIMSNVSFGSIKRFENTGQISFLSLSKIAKALDMLDEIINLFNYVEYKNISEVINE